MTRAIAQDRLELERRLVIARPRQAVGDDRRLERDDGTAGGERVGDLGGDGERASQERSCLTFATLVRGRQAAGVPIDDLARVEVASRVGRRRTGRA